MAKMRASPCVLLETPIEVRVDLLLDEYRHFLEDRQTLDAQLDCLVALHGRERIAEWKALTDWRELVARLLVEHYDPAYRHSSTKNFVRLGGAQTLHIASAHHSAFAAAASSLLERAPITA
jgi:tRNA 2-selenouridine synthase